MGTFNFKKFITLSGKVGPLVLYATKEGKQLFRTYTKPANPRTPRQTAHRARFGLVNKALSPLNNVIKQGYPGEKNDYRTLVGKALREAVEGEYPHLVFNYGKIQIARGQLPVPPDVQKEYDASTRELHFSWHPHPAATPPCGSHNDKVILVCLHAAEHPEVITLHAGNRDAGEATFTLPDGWQAGHTHCWLYLNSHDQQAISNSVYIV